MAEQMEGLPKQIAAFLNLLIEPATTQTKKQGEFTIPAWASWSRHSAARIGRNPATGEAIKIKAKTTVKFRRQRPPKMPWSRPKPSWDSQT